MRKRPEFPRTKSDYLTAVAIETARMSYPGRMGTVVKKGTKKKVEEYFADTFPLRQVWDHASTIALRFDEWHAERTGELESVLKDRMHPGKLPLPVAAKFLNTFLHQLTKYGPCRPLYVKLHLPLDRRVFEALGRLKSASESLGAIGELLQKAQRKPYTITSDEYRKIQRALDSLKDELNRRRNTEWRLSARIDLNVLWGVWQGSRPRVSGARA